MDKRQSTEWTASGSAISNGREPKSCLGWVFNSKLGHIAILHNKCMAWHAATSGVENWAQGLSCQLKFVHDSILIISGSKNNQILLARFVVYRQKIGPNVATFKTMVLTQNVVRVQGTHVSCYSQHYIFFVAYESAQSAWVLNNTRLGRLITNTLT